MKSVSKSNVTNISIPSSFLTKFFFGRYLAYARDVGDAALVKHVKERARAWVESQAGGGDE